DSIGLGEDGPTHQPIEHLMSLRIIPNMRVLRPADSYETVYAWQYALTNQAGPTAIILTRQKTKNLTYGRAHELSKGGYTINPDVVNPDIILVASGSEVMIAEEASHQLIALGMKVRLVSVPSLELFLSQPVSYRESVLPPMISKRIVIEAGITWGWETIAGPQGHILGINTFGASAPASALFKNYGLTSEHVVQLAKTIMKIS
ncbi:MAG: transketolase-like TK C-terminal-containing protein, partial [Holophagaceae bacterium]